MYSETLVATVAPERATDRSVTWESSNKNVATVNENGYKVETEARREVFVNKKSATRSEFYAAKQAGDKIALVLEVRGSDYESETRIEYGGNPYEVVRTYTRAGEVIELNCKEAPKPAEGAKDGGGEGAAV